LQFLDGSFARIWFSALELSLSIGLEVPASQTICCRPVGHFATARLA
jgi:hypothetical protein